jgi:hypothetical protein
MRSLFTFLFLVATSSTLQSWADPIEETSAFLRDPSAHPTDPKVRQLGLPPAGEARVYGLSAGIFENLARENGGDAEQLTRSVNELVRNPASLEQKLTPDQKSELKSISQEVEPREKTPLMAP